MLVVVYDKCFGCRGTKALLVVQQVLQQSSMQELALFSLVASPNNKQLKIRLDKV